MLYPLSYEGDARGFYPISSAGSASGVLRLVAASADEPFPRYERVGPESAAVFRQREGVRGTASIIVV